jgi:uncharacterized protein YjfI (DUF2170 family)
MTLHLLKSIDNNNNLKLVDLETSGDYEPFVVSQIKILIINNLLIPISNDNLDQVLTNEYLISFYKDKIIQFISIFNDKYDLKTYKYILDVVSYAIIYHRIILASRRISIKDKEFGKVQKHLGIIHFKAEYILYDKIIGKPDMKNKEKYNKDILNAIRVLLNSLDVDYNKIEKIITDQFK